MKLPQYCAVGRVNNPIQQERASPIISMCATLAPPADPMQTQISVVGFPQLSFFFKSCSKCTLHFLAVGQVFKTLSIELPDYYLFSAQALNSFLYQISLPPTSPWRSKTPDTSPPKETGCFHCSFPAACPFFSPSFSNSSSACFPLSVYL